MGSSRVSNLVNLHSNTPADGFTLTLLPTIHSGVLFKSFFGLDSRQGTPPCLLRNNLQFWCMRNSLGFSRIPQLAWVQDQGRLKGWEPRALCHSSKGSTAQSCRHFSFYPAPSTPPPPPAWPQVYPLSYQHSAKAQPCPWAFVLDPKRPWGQEKRTVE